MRLSKHLWLAFIMHSQVIFGQEFEDDFTRIDTIRIVQKGQSLELIESYQYDQLRHKVISDLKGKKQFEGWYLDSLVLLMKYDDNSRLPSEIRMKHMRDTIGFTFEFYPHGRLEVYHDGIDSLPQGEYVFYRKGGEIATKGLYNNGYIGAMGTYDFDGTLLEIITPSPLSKSLGNTVRYYPSGRIASLVTHLSDSTYVETSFHQDGRESDETKYVNERVVERREPRDYGYEIIYFSEFGLPERKEQYNIKGKLIKKE